MVEATASMTAAYVTGPGPADAITVGRLPVPGPGPFDVLVRTEALAVNHVDTFIRSGAFPMTLPSPFVVGRDVVGRVAALGSAVRGLAAGDRVWCNSLGIGGRQGPFAEYALAPADRLYRLPGGVDPEVAVAVLHTAGTAHLGLFREAGLSLGETVVVAGAGGGVGSAAVQLAAAAGARVLATARADDVAWCHECGADDVVDHHAPDPWTRLAELAPDGVDVLWDTSGRADLETTLPLLATGGRMLVTADLTATPVLPVGPMYTRDVSLHGFAITNATTADLASIAAAVNHALVRGVLRPRIGARLPLTATAEAHRLQEAGEVRGRIVVAP